MESTVLGLILDSSVVIEAERIGYSVRQMLSRIVSITGDTESAIGVVTVAELARCAPYANTRERAIRRRSFLDELKLPVKTFSITDSTAEVVGRVGATAAALGKKIPFDDLLIGACALEHGYGVLTKNLRHFRLIPGLEVLPLDLP